jgi:MATE family multidrug resistance protein
VDVFNVSYENYLIAIGVMEPSMWAELTVNVGVLILNILFVYYYKFGYESLAWSWVISVYLSGVVHLILSWNYPAVQRTLRPWTKDALKDWGQFISLGLPGTIMLCSEWWAYEILVLFASMLGTEEVAAQSIILQCASLAFMIPCGLGEATTSLVGNALGARRNELAIRVSKLSLWMILAVELVLGALVLYGGVYFINLCTPDEVVRNMAAESLPFLALFTIVDGLQGVAAGILKGAGRQSICAFFNVISFYVIGLPMAFLLCFHTVLKVNGLMMGIAIGASFQVTISIFLIFLRESFVFTASIDNHHSSLHTFENIVITDMKTLKATNDGTNNEINGITRRSNNSSCDNFSRSSTSSNSRPNLSSLKRIIVPFLDTSKINFKRSLLNAETKCYQALHSNDHQGCQA